jgi:hypothetical protein
LAQILTHCVRCKAQITGHRLDFFGISQATDPNGLPDIHGNHPLGRSSRAVWSSEPSPSRGATCFMQSGVQISDSARGSNLRDRFHLLFAPDLCTITPPYGLMPHALCYNPPRNAAGHIKRSRFSALERLRSVPPARKPPASSRPREPAMPTCSPSSRRRCARTQDNKVGPHLRPVL